MPEFFWNVPWDEVKDEPEIWSLTEFYLTSLSGVVRELVRDLSIDKYGKVVVLAGTVATLAWVLNNSDPYYDAINYNLTTSNFKKVGDGEPEVLLWPKRNVSPIDFGTVNLNDFDRSRLPDWWEQDRDNFWFFKLSVFLKIRVKNTA
ncbi:hypothetical protein NUH87_30750 [Pseudomonas batumici]|uniref:hypothetical protein n=1 Tax=Pseudomonas batumici TaxID=226910 RepID=UPI0030CC1091